MCSDENRVSNLLSRLRTPVSVAALGLACIFTHEVGHALASLLTGAHITGFVLFSLRPHVSTAGVQTPGELAFTAAAGSAFFLSLWFALLLWCRTPRFREYLTTVTSFAYVELLGWSLSCFWPPHGGSPDDAEYFIAVSGADPYLVFSICILIACAGTCLL